MGKWCGVATYFFIQKKKEKRKNKYKLHFQNALNVVNWIKKNTILVNEPYKALVPSYNLCERIQNFGPSYNLPKLKDKTLIYLPKNPLFKGKVTEWEGVRQPFRPNKA